MRLNKFMATCGVASRRHCDEIIEQGRVKINAVITKKLGVQVNPDTDIVTVDDKPLRIKGPFIYIMMNKPVGYITSVKDPQGRKTVMDLLPKTDKRIYPIGRLDYNTSGLLLLTNDGDTAQKLMHPSYEFGKTYIANIKGDISEDELEVLRNGVDICDFVTSKAQVSVLRHNKEETRIKLTIHEGKNRQIRRMFLALNKQVKSLERVYLGKLYLGNLPLGQCRHLTEDEVQYLLNL